MRLSELVVQVDGSRARALFRAEAEGQGAIRLGYVGGEEARLDWRGGRWQLDGPLLPRLAGVLSALERREAALSAGDGAALAALGEDAGPAIAKAGAEPAPAAFFVRIEGDRATVSEVGVDRRTHRLELRFAGSGWRFTSGLL